MGDEDFRPEITGQPSKKLKQKRIESKDMFWLSLVEQLKGNKVAITNKEKKNQTSVKKDSKEVVLPEQEREEFFVVKDDDMYDEPKKEEPVNKNSQRLAESNQHFKTMPSKKQNVFMISDDLSPLIDDNFRPK